MSFSALFLECVRLAPYSRRLRALGRMWERRGLAEVPPHQVAVVQRLMKDVKIRLGEQVEPEVYFPPDRVPRGASEALRFLQHPELFDTETFERARWHAVFPADGFGHPMLRPFADAVLRLGRERLIPLVVALAYVEPAVQRAAFLRGETPVSADDSAHCQGCAVRFEHIVDHGWPGSTGRFLRDLGLLAAAEVGVAVGWSASDPQRFVLADADGVCAGPVVERGTVETGGDALLRFYAGLSQTVAWEARCVVQPMPGKSGRDRPGSGGRAVAWTVRRNPETGDFEACEVSED